MSRTYFTISTGSHLAGALTLARSLKRAEPDRRFFLFLVDQPASLVETDDASITVIGCDLLAGSELEDMASRYSALELCCALKPFAFDYVFDVLLCAEAVYLDSDIFVTAPLDHVHEALGSGASCVLTPHVTKGLRDGHIPDEDIFFTVGIFNMGFAAFRNVPEARAFITWWRGKLVHDCVPAMERGILLDQSYCNLAPCFIERFVFLHNPGYNLAYWNLAHRPVTMAGGRYVIAGEPVRFVHFSSLERDNPSRISRYENRFSWDATGAFREIIESYIAEIDRNDRYSGGRYSAVSYGFARHRRSIPANKVEIRTRRHCADAEFDNALTSPLSILRNFLRRVFMGHRYTAAHWEKVRRDRG